MKLSLKYDEALFSSDRSGKGCNLGLGKMLDLVLICAALSNTNTTLMTFAFDCLLVRLQYSTASIVIQYN